MKKTKKFFVLALASTAFALSGCNSIFGTADKVKDETKDSETKSNDAAQDASNLATFDDNGHFRNEKVYNFVNNETNKQINYTFKTDGSLSMVDVATSETFNYTYKANSNLIEIKSSSNKIEYIDYAEDILYHPVNFSSSSRAGYETFIGGAIGYRSGVGKPIADRSSSSVVGYHIDLQASVGDTKAIFSTNKETSKGIAYPIFANGKVDTGLKNSKTIPIDSSYFQVDVLDTSKVGNQIVDLVINSKTYKAILRVGAAAQKDDGDAVNSMGYFNSEKIFHFLSTVDGKKMEYTFDNAGTLTTKNVWTEETASYTYKVDGNIIEIKDTANNVSYLDYYQNVLAHPVYENGEFKNASMGYLDGYAAALQSSSNVLGYHFELNVSVGDTKDVFGSSKSKSKGFAYPIYANATIKNDKSASAVRYVQKSEINAETIDTAEAGNQIISLTISNKEYKAVLKVA